MKPLPSCNIFSSNMKIHEQNYLSFDWGQKSKIYKQVKIFGNSNDYDFYSGNFYKYQFTMYNKVLYEDYSEGQTIIPYE